MSPMAIQGALTSIAVVLTTNVLTYFAAWGKFSSQDTATIVSAGVILAGAAVGGAISAWQRRETAVVGAATKAAPDKMISAVENLPQVKQVVQQ